MSVHEHSHTSGETSRPVDLEIGKRTKTGGVHSGGTKHERVDGRSHGNHAHHHAEVTLSGTLEGHTRGRESASHHRHSHHYGVAHSSPTRKEAAESLKDHERPMVALWSRNNPNGAMFADCAKVCHPPHATIVGVSSTQFVDANGQVSHPTFPPHSSHYNAMLTTNFADHCCFRDCGDGRQHSVVQRNRQPV